MPCQQEKTTFTFTRWPGDIIEGCLFEGAASVCGVLVLGEDSGAFDAVSDYDFPASSSF